MLSRLGRAALIAGTSLTVVASAGYASAAATPATPAHHHRRSRSATAVSKLMHRPDSGDNGTWAKDRLVRRAQITLVSRVSNTASTCGGGAGACYHFRARINDKGTFTTITGAKSPGVGDLNGGSAPTIAAALTGPMTGVYHYNFYSSSRNIKASRVVKREPGNPSGAETTCMWPAQFFPVGTLFWTSGGAAQPVASGCIGTTGGWTYTLGFGADSACPNVASRWFDGTPYWGETDLSTGNILVPDSSHC